MKIIFGVIIGVVLVIGTILYIKYKEQVNNFVKGIVAKIKKK